MTDLDTLRRALRAPQPDDWHALDVDRIITRGRRLRWRRRLAVAGTVGCVAVAAAVSGTLAGGGSSGRPGLGPVPAHRPLAPSRLAHEQSPTYPAPRATPMPTQSPTGSLPPSPVTSPGAEATSAPSTLSAPLPTPSR